MMRQAYPPGLEPNAPAFGFRGQDGQIYYYRHGVDVEAGKEVRTYALQTSGPLILADVLKNPVLDESGFQIITSRIIAIYSSIHPWTGRSEVT